MTDDIVLNDDDFGGSVADPEQYPDTEEFTLLPDGTYNLKLLDAKVDVDPDTGEVRNRKFPKFIATIKVLGGDFDGRQAFYVPIATTIRERDGLKTSQLGDLIHAIDPTFHMGGSITRAQKFLQQAVSDGLPFRAKTAWFAFDMDYFNEMGGPTLPNGSDELKDLRKTCAVRGMKRFPINGNGKRDSEITGPSGATLRAKVTLDRIYSKKG